MDDFWQALEQADATRCVVVTDPPSGLRAFIVLDDLTLGPAAGGVRTKRYESARHALEDAALLARAMTLKCALAGLDAGGGKAVVMEHAALDRMRAFERLGERVEELGGIFRTSGDLGTSEEDLQAMARGTQYVSADVPRLAAAVAAGLVRCVDACATRRGRSLEGLTVAVQGAGAVGHAAARALSAAKAKVLISDLDEELARRVASEVGGSMCSANGLLLTEVDVLVPCATGGVVDMDTARKIRAWALCGAANNVLVGPEVAAVLKDREILHVPDPISSAGGVIAGLCADDETRTEVLLEQLRTTASTVLERAAEEDRTPSAVAQSMAWDRIREGAKST